MRLERAVLAVALARPRQRQREVARERDAAAHPRSLRSARALLAAALLLAGCGGSASDGAPNRGATLTLDAPPNAVHAAIELAVQRGFTDAEGVELEVRAPQKRADPVTLLRTGRTDFAILGLRDLAIARAKGRDLVAVMAIVQDPLPARERGAPSHPGLVLAVTRETLQDSPDLVRATVHALQRGYRETLADPESAIAALATAAPGTDRVAAGKQLDAVATSFQGHDGTIGTFDVRALEQWVAWAQRTGIVDERPAVKLMFEGSFARSGAGKAAEEDG